MTNTSTKYETATADGALLPPDPPTPSSSLRLWDDQLQADYERMLTVGEECVTATELKALLLRKGRGSNETTTTGGGFRLYDGFEPSGRMHIAQGLLKAAHVNKCVEEGSNGTFVFWVADWFALMNDKMGGDLEKIRVVGQYLQQVWKAAGMNLDHVEFCWASHDITQHATTYWPTMLDIARRFNITRIKKCCQIMGRLENSLTAAQVLYPLMQCTDIFFLRADICQLGVDQRKVNMLAREYCDAAKIKHKPVILSHHMLYGLKAGQEKMSKSDPDSAIFMEDSAVDVHRKIMQAYCPNQEMVEASSGHDEGTPSFTAAGENEENEEEEDAGKASIHLDADRLKNPCLDYIQHIVMGRPNATFTAGGVTYQQFADIRAAFIQGSLSEADLKKALIDVLNELLEPVRQHFTNDATAKHLLETVQQYKKEAATRTPNTDKVPRRLNLVQQGLVPAGSHLIMAPFPCAAPTLQTAMDLLFLLRTAEGDDTVNVSPPKVLYLPDWSARVVNAFDADTKAITAYYTILLTALRALDSQCMMAVTIVWQSEAILADPSNYWISVINAGRHFALQNVMGPQMTDSECVGCIVARLMRLADVAGVEPRAISLLVSNNNEHQVDDDNDNNDDESRLIQFLVTEFFASQLPSLVQPQIQLYSNAPSIRLQPVRESEALKQEHDEYFLLDDPKVHGKSKLKKAFCEEGNIDFCPPIALVEVFVFGRQSAVTAATTSSSLSILRSPENGGNMNYETIADLRRDFQSKSLHPGDLKTAVMPIMVQVLDTLVASFKADAATTKAVKDLKAFAKKQSKTKK